MARSPFAHGIIDPSAVDPWDVALYMATAPEWRFRENPIIAMSEATRRAVSPGNSSLVFYWTLVYLGLYMAAGDYDARVSCVIWDVLSRLWFG